MSLKPYYPTLNLGGIASLLTLRQQMDAHEDYLAREDCPYDADTKDQIARIMATRIVEVPVERVVEKIVEKRVEVAVAAAEGGGKRGPKQKAAGVDVIEVAREIEEIRSELRHVDVGAGWLELLPRTG